MCLFVEFEIDWIVNWLYCDVILTKYFNKDSCINQVLEWLCYSDLNFTIFKFKD